VAGARPDDDESSADQHGPQDDQAEVEAADELAQGHDDLWAALGQRAGDRGEHCERCEAHHIIGDLQHYPDQCLDAADDRLALLADGGERYAEEDREDNDRQDLVAAHRLEDRGGDEVADEILQVECRRLNAAGRRRRRQRQV
jgi:hypothetical protein